MTGYITRPLSDRSWLRQQSQRTGTRFSAKWSDTLELLYREVEFLAGRDMVIEVDVRDSDLRIDGTIKARARASSPGVVVAFESKHGPLMYRCDQFFVPYYGQGDDWQHNVRAVALTLESLRAVDRYGATASGQQYAGWKAIATAPHCDGEPLDEWAAWQQLRDLAHMPSVAIHDGEDEQIIARARRFAHPDNGGTRADWDRFTTAYAVVRP